MQGCQFSAFVDFFSTHPQGFQINDRNSRGYAPIHEAVSKNDIGVLRGLLAAKCDANLLSSSGLTPLTTAIWSENYYTAKLLLEYNKLNVNAKSNKIGTALHAGCNKLHVDLVV